MDLLESIQKAQGGRAVEHLAKQFGLEPGQTTGALEQLLPALTTGIDRNAKNQVGLESLLGALSGGDHERYLDDPAALSAPETVDDGNEILGHILGGKDASRQVAARASAETGISGDILKRMLPLVATLVMGVLEKQTAGVREEARGGGLLETLGPLLGGKAGAGDSIIDQITSQLGNPSR